MFAPLAPMQWTTNACGLFKKRELCDYNAGTFRSIINSMALRNEIASQKIMFSRVK